MADQAQGLRDIAWEKKRKAVYITVSSGKGGVGKTNFSVNLSYQLSKMGKNVLLFDADLGLANVDILLNMSVKKSIKDYLSGTISPEELATESGYGFDIIPASSGFIELTKIDEKGYDSLINIFIALDSKYDYIIFDTGAGISENVIKFSPIANFLIVITQAEPTAVTDAYAFMKVVIKEYDIKTPYLVVNRSKSLDSGKQIYEHLNTVMKKFLNRNLELLGIIREDSTVVKSVREQKPVAHIFPDSSYSRDIQTIALKLCNLPVSNQTEEIGKLFRRLDI